MRAAELVEEYPVVGLDADGFQAARLLAERRLPGLIVVDAEGRPHTVLPGSQVLRFVIPRYVQEDTALARVFDEEHADVMARKLRGTRVRDLLPKAPVELPVVAHDATAMEIAAVMARLRSPLVAVLRDREVLGAVTVSRLLGVLLERA
jgi:CBS domain-containing protein